MPTYDAEKAKELIDVARDGTRIIRLTMYLGLADQLLAATQEIERLRRDNERLDGVTKALAGSHARLREENEALRKLVDRAGYIWSCRNAAPPTITADEADRAFAAIRRAAGLEEG